MSLVRGRLEQLIKEEFRMITLYIAVGLLVMLAAICRRLHLVIVAVIPLLMSLAATVTVMAAFDLKLNYMNIVAFPLIIGMGIDNGIHIIFRYFEAGERSVKLTVGQTGQGILVTSLTTMSGFGSLLFTDHNGLISLGIVTCVGIGVCLLTSLCVLPGLLRLWQPPGEGEPPAEGTKPGTEGALQQNRR
jgi:predicted RND superfamily exporter protein